MTQVLVCSEDGCPVSTDGRCLEGFTPPDTCPHSRTRATEGLNHNDDVDLEEVTPGDDDDVTEDDDEPLPARPGEVQWVELGGDVALSLREADELAARTPCRVVLVAGEFESGKTTLVVELYARFLHAPFADADFGGSATLRALDARHGPARATSGRSTPKTERTQDEDMRLLHLRLRRHGRVHDTLFSDVKGEFFEAIAHSAGAIKDVPLVARADLCLVLVDGAAIADPRKRQTAVTRARLLLAGLADPEGLLPGTSTVIVLTKLDLVDPMDRPWAESQLEALRERAVSLGLAASALCVAARPLDQPPEGLDRLLDHILPPPTTQSVRAEPVEPGDRQFWNQPEVAR